MDSISAEITTLESERKMGATAIKASQTQLAERLKGSLGDDIDKVLSGERKVKFSLWQRIRYKIDKFLELFTWSSSSME